LKKKPAAAAPVEPKLGFFGKRPWLYVVIAFMSRVHRLERHVHLGDQASA